MYQIISHHIKPLAKSTLITLVAVLGISCSQNKAAEETLLKPIKQDNKYATSKIQSLNPVFEITIPGEIIPYEQVQIHAKVSGFVKDILVESGDYVKKGQLLARLEAPEMQQNYLVDKSKEQKAYSDYVYAKQSYERLLEAAKTPGAVASIELESSRAGLDSSLAAYNASKASSLHANELQEYLTIRAPFDGVVTHRGVSVGALTNASTSPSLFTIAQNDKLRLVVYLPQKYSSSVRVGSLASFSLSAYPGKIFNTKVSRSAGVMDQKDKSLRLELDIDNSNKALTGGDYAQVSMQLRRENPTFWTKTKSILTTQSGNFVYVLNDKQINRIPVEIGVRLDTLTEVFGDFKTHDNIIINPSEQIAIGSM